MRLSRGELGALFEHIVKRQRPGIQPDPAAITAAYEEAEALASERPTRLGRLPSAAGSAGPLFEMSTLLFLASRITPAVRVPLV